MSFPSPSPQGCGILDRSRGMRHHKQPILDFCPPRRIREVNEIKTGTKPSHPTPPPLNREVLPIERHSIREAKQIERNPIRLATNTHA